jgi:hypothetical protein
LLRRPTVLSIHETAFQLPENVRVNKNLAELPSGKGHFIISSLTRTWNDYSLPEVAPSISIRAAFSPKNIPDEKYTLSACRLVGCIHGLCHRAPATQHYCHHGG